MQASLAPTKIYRISEVIARTGISRTSLWRLERTGDFPSRRRLGVRSIGWLAAEIDAWIASREPAAPQSNVVAARVSP